MKTASVAMKALLASRVPLIYADLYTITLIGGGVLRYTTYDIALTVSGTAFLKGPIITRTSISSAVWGVNDEPGGGGGFTVQSMDIEITPGANLVNGLAWLIAAKRGAFDGASVLLERTAMPTAGDVSAGKWWKFSGNMADIDADRMSMSAAVRSKEEIFNRLVPVDISQPSCRNTLYLGRCGLTKETFGVNSTVSSGSTVLSVNCALAQAAGYFSLGTVNFTSGANNGIVRSIKKYTPGVITLARPLLAAPAAADTIRAYPGCDKSMATCLNKFANLNNFRGEPFVPVPETTF